MQNNDLVSFSHFLSHFYIPPMRSPHTGSSHANPTAPTFHLKGSRARLRGAAPCQKAGAARTLDPVMQIPWRMPPPQRIARNGVCRDLGRSPHAGSSHAISRNTDRGEIASNTSIDPAFQTLLPLRLGLNTRVFTPRKPTSNSITRHRILCHRNRRCSASAAASASASACSASYSAIQSLGTTRTMRRTPVSCRYLWRWFCVTFLPRADSDAAP